jgi:uncharacterized coiled-coil protein SlyX
MLLEGHPTSRHTPARGANRLIGAEYEQIARNFDQQALRPATIRAFPARSTCRIMADTKGSAANWDAAVIPGIRHPNQRGGVEMQNGFRSGIIDRAVANARAIRQAPETIILLSIVAAGAGGFEFQQYRERLADLNGRLASQDRLLTAYRTKLTGVEAQIEKLSAALTDAKKSLKAAKPIPTSAEYQSRNPRSLYEDNNPVAQVQDPKIDVDLKRVIFLAVDSANLLQTDKFYEFQNWKLACRGTGLYNMVTDGVSREFSYSPLTCKIVGDR